ncbi:MAG: hypothetical protein LC725_03270, partial [Lentisphaerae bacterium]|nr:hypothetical protein [Lentisphaerota bacterium]
MSKKRVLVGLMLCLIFSFNIYASQSIVENGKANAEIMIVENGKNAVPIVVFKDAPKYTRQAADDLATYIEKTSGAKPEVIEGTPNPLPEHAIWVGY